MNNKKVDKFNINEMYRDFSITDVDNFLNNINVEIKTGLTDFQVKENFEKYGNNELNQNKPKQWYNYLWDSLSSPFNLILFGIVLVLFYTDVILTSPSSYSNIIVVFALIIISTFLEFFEVFNSNKAANKLKSLVATNTTVLRNGNAVKIPLKDITYGDIILLSAGDLIPADLRIIESKNLYVSQSSLTGESDAIEKIATANSNEMSLLTDFNNICFMGTNVTSGSGKGVVFKTANHTYFSKIADTINTGKPETSFQKGISNTSKLLIKFMLVLIPITFLLNSFKHDTLIAFTFSVAIAIGITPLLLPVILSSSLAKGAIKMSKKKTIVKKLDSIQSFGAMNILCTDKTGTLTEDKIVLEKYLDIKGNEDFRILKHVYLNSFFQTGLKGNIDTAIINRWNNENLENIIHNYTKIDEIPFDFSRRRLSIIVSDGIKKQMITKGAIEEILDICSMVDYKGVVSSLTPQIKTNILNISKSLNIDGMRVIGVCQKNDISSISNFSPSEEKNMVFLGFIGFLDPPKESAKKAINRLNNDGIRVIVLTGDNQYVTRAICNKVNINTSKILSGNDIEKMTDIAITRHLQDTNIFAKLSPIQKARIIRLLEAEGNIVGYMGDGINDAPSLTNSEVGISVDTAVDIAKETADIILLEKNLNVLTDGVMEGRKTFGNLLKYIKMAVSFNFGEVLSVLIASILLPFFPITPIQLLVQSLLYDFGQLSLPFDNVDTEYLRKPQKWNLQSIKKFMLYMGPTSSVFDLIVFAVLWFGFGLRIPQAALFQTIWFSYGVVSNLVGLHVIRTSKIPFFQSNASKSVYISSISLSLIALIIPFTNIGSFLGLVPLSAKYIVLIITVPILYCFVAMFIKKLYIKKYGDWI